MSTGFYIGLSQTEEVQKMNACQMPEKIRKDITEDVDETGICSGMIG